MNSSLTAIATSANSRMKNAPSMNVLPEREMTSEQYIRLRDLIYQKLGLFFEDSKVYFIKRRVERRLVALQLDRRVEPSEKGGDRKSKKYLKTAKINPL